MKIVNRKFIPYVLVASMLLTGCGKQKNNGNSSINVTPTIPSQISNTPSEDSKVQTYEEKAQETYSENIQFYTNLGLAYAYNGETNIDRIENMLKTINGNVSDLTQSQVNDSCEAIKNVLLSQELTSYLNDVNSYELGYLSTLDDASLIYPASLVKYVTNSETKEILMKFENIRNKVINDLNTSKKVSEETKQEIKRLVCEMEYTYYPDRDNMNNDVISEGNKLLENCVKKSLIDLTISATNQTRIFPEKDTEYYSYFPNGLKLAAETDKEKELISTVLINGIDSLTDEQKLSYQKLMNEKVDTKYIDGICSHQENLRDHAKDELNVYSSNILTLKYADIKNII